MEFIICLLIGYLFGSVSLAAVMSRLTKVSLRNNGTGNLGATNTFLVIGKGYGVIVMLFDIAKAFAASRIAAALFPGLAVSGVLAGLGAVLGHIFPFYMKFSGGKGLAAFGGMVLAFDPAIFLMLLAIALVLMVIVNYSAAMPYSAAILFPLLVWIRLKSVAAILITSAASVLIMIKHAENITKARNGTDVKVREFIKTELFSKKKH